MKKRGVTRIAGAIFNLLLLLTPFAVSAQTEPVKTPGPAIGQQLVREGAFAVKLADVLEVVSTDDEVEAESRLGELGIAPRNGWIADYPVTPDIVVELQNAVSAAAEADKLNFEKDEALRRFDRVNQEFSLGIKPHAGGAQAPGNQLTAGTLENQTVINNYYSEQGPPVVTYYTPPADYVYLYGWVPSPFWSFGLWFPGFFILNDFHRVVHINNRVHFISNHYNDFRRHRVFRIDAASRFHGRTYGGIGASRPRASLATGVRNSDRKIFNSGRNWAPRNDLRSGNPSAGSRTYSTPSRGGNPSVHRGGMGNANRSAAGASPSRGSGARRERR
jgi:hypothetical protein